MITSASSSRREVAPWQGPLVGLALNHTELDGEDGDGRRELLMVCDVYCTWSGSVHCRHDDNWNIWRSSSLVSAVNAVGSTSVP